MTSRCCRGSAGTNCGLERGESAAVCTRMTSPPSRPARGFARRGARRAGRAAALIVALACSLALSPPLPAAEKTLAQITQESRDRIVFLSAKVTLPTGELRESTGTGFLLAKTGYVLTASHVLSPAGIYDKAAVVGAVRTRYGHAWPLEVIADDPRRDLLLLQFKNVGIEWSGVELGNPDEDEPGESLFVMGFPLEYDLSSKKGELSGKGGPGGSWMTTVPLNLGDSGAPVFDGNGRVVAMVVSGLADARGIAFCVPINIAADYLQIAGVQLRRAVPCRHPAHGIETWKSEDVVRVDSGWRGGGSSPGEFCGAQLADRLRQHPDRKVVLLSSREDHKSEYTPFKQDYYIYYCEFQESWDPVYKLAISEHCLPGG
jgi:S1-C subfamily serine protease